MIVKAKAIRLSILISTIVIGLIVVIQAFWLRRVYLYEEVEFDRKVVGAIKGLYDDINLLEDSTKYLNEVITKPEPHIYIAMIGKWEPEDTISYFLHHELEDFGVFTDCRLTLYDVHRGIFFEKDIPSATGRKTVLQAVPLQLTKLSRNSIILYFPHRERYILSNMIFWIVTSLILLGVIVWLGLSLFYLNRQKSLNELQRDFVNNFSHEFKTPLAVISLAVESLKKNSTAEKKEKIIKYADMIGGQSKYLQGQIDRLLRHSFSEKTELQLIRENVNIHELIREATTNLQPLIEQKNAEIHFEFNAEEANVNADKNYMLIVLINLIENALKYSNDPKVVISTVNKNHNLEISVKDNGIGIEKRFFHDIFKKFFRVPKGDIHSSKGFGIGLSFVKKIIDSHHGTIKVESVPGIGSNFIISLNQSQF
ncbi:MAG: HAMP domain-containing histidine kinase [Bacteroidetes bacterium]|nr:HAMP domain-containing histidine kinase [Bacteroidota bacterium]MBS1932116.1 HAMP domain-containing histidine kinase [Bacteroidota bacterium]